jgi:DNA-3-methyladenine glycosylase
LPKGQRDARIARGDRDTPGAARQPASSTAAKGLTMPHPHGAGVRRAGHDMPARRAKRAQSAIGGAVGVDLAARLPRAFFARPAARVARALLGCLLVRRLPASAGGGLLAGRIVEAEAYVGEEDRACHAHTGKTRRNAVMYGPPGHAYVYFIYGMYDMMNVVCQPEGRPEAVLLRALEPVHGVDAMRRRRRTARRDTDLASGPGKLCRALAITRAQNGLDLCGDRLWIAPAPAFIGADARRHAERNETIATGPRIGIDYAGADAALPLRFWLAGNPHVSRAR